ncbi:right-handed parallel beta-helix repeat-containing protein [Paludisphaera rhizosphaerae]|uniref:right-handed parallel beta-helix repeat-containing protein n=1 Tax=Paludisphaera rhizosphaerae TaxID=2711216 RepID=UPI0013EDCF9E|nr:right-handed parallel beta-helix repeat-containing protein [Paludisphaera rhizosphaerae]
MGLWAAVLPAYNVLAGEVPERPQWVAEVLEGRRHEARASWWGFDAHDSTAFLQKAINSKVKRLIIDRQPSPWVTRPLTGVSGQEIVFESGVELVALKGSYQAKSDCLLTFNQCERVTVRGEKGDAGELPVIRMEKEDYQSAAYEKSEWRHGLVFLGCREVRVEDLRIERTGGDGVYLGTGPDKIPNRDVVIRGVDFNANHRQGISVISAENLLVERCLLRNTKGTAPQAGVDFEPNDPADVLVNCVVRHCVASGNSGTGYQICSQSLAGRSKPVSIVIEDCVSRGNAQHAVHLVSAPKDPPPGRLQIARFLAEDDAMSGLAVQFNPYDAIRIDLEDVTFRDCAKADSFFAPLYLQGTDLVGRPAGNLHFDRVTVKDEVDRPPFFIRGPKGSRPAEVTRDVTGRILLQRNGRERTLEALDAAERDRVVAPGTPAS